MTDPDIPDIDLTAVPNANGYINISVCLTTESYSIAFDCIHGNDIVNRRVFDYLAKHFGLEGKPDDDIIDMLYLISVIHKGVCPL